MLFFKTKARYGYILVLLITFDLNTSFADEKIDETLSEEQKALQAEVEHSLVAPCCWNMTVDQHDSPAARQVRTKIAELVKAGKSKDEILSYFSSQPQYGERILAAPSQDTLLGKSAYWLIPIALILGTIIVVKTIKSLAQTGGEEQVKPAETDKSDESSPYAKKVEEELRNFES